MRNTNLPLLSYLANSAKQGKNIPSIVQLSEELSLSTAAVREQLAVARQLEVVEVKTKTGIHTSPFSVAPAICLAFRYGLELDPSMRGEIASVRQHLELAFWNEAVSKLTEKDVAYLEEMLASFSGAIVVVSHDEYFLDAIRVDQRISVGRAV